ncbi:MAG: hypothetical protein OXC01_09260 [Immundisolibacterales bacterium]|nr:hypothetical protein [Immundisolibacterales bacterium]
MTAYRIVAVAMLAAVGTAWAQDSGREIRDSLAEKLDVFNLCPVEERVDLFVDELPEHAANAGLTTKAVREAIESRLRGARLHDRSAGPLLHARFAIGVPEEGHVPFYSIEISFLRELFAERAGLFALAETWSTAGSGQGDADSFLAHLDGLVGEFIAEHVRVRGTRACIELRRQAAAGAKSPGSG